jgi:hypothetical protein
MAEPTITESSTFPANEYLDDFFSDKPTDLRFTKTHYKKFSPITQHDKTGRIFEFSLPAQKAPYVYIFEDTYMSARVSIRKKNGELPDQFLPPSQPRKRPMANNVGPVNCAVSSLFEDVQTFINDNQIEISNNYQYRSFFNDLLSFDDVCKISLMETTGFRQDHAKTDNSLGNNGWLSRCAWFKINGELGEAYRDDGATFMAPFRHILWGCEKPIPPGCTIRFLLKRLPDDFYIMQTEEDNTEYVVNIDKLDLYVKVAGLQKSLWDELENRLAKSAIKYFLRKIDVKVYHLPRNWTKWTTDRLFPDNTIPSKVFFALIPTAAYSGNPKMNPYEFKRRWEKDAFETDGSSTNQLKESLLQEKLRSQIEENRRMQEFYQQQRETDKKEREMEKEKEKREREREKEELRLQHEQTRLLLLQLLSQTGQNITLDTCASVSKSTDNNNESNQLHKKRSLRSQRSETDVSKHLPSKKGKRTQKIPIKKSKNAKDDHDPDYVEEEEEEEEEEESDELEDLENSSEEETQSETFQSFKDDEEKKKAERSTSPNSTVSSRSQNLAEKKKKLLQLQLRKFLFKR